MADFLRAAPFLYREHQDAFQPNLDSFSASVRARAPACLFDAQGLPEFPVGYWYLSPEQHVYEFLVFNAVFLPLLWWLLQRPLAVDVPALPADASAARYAPARARAHHWALVCLDGLCTAALWATGLLTVFFKLRPDCMGRPRLAYLVQPCHLSNFILMLLSCLRGASPGAVWLFEFYLVSAFGALCALATPDLRGLDLWPFGSEGLLAAERWGGYTWEIVSFFVQHALLLLLPAVWMARRRFALVQPPAVSARGCVTMWAVLSVVHWDVFAPLSYLTGHNVNYMLVPPGGPLHKSAGLIPAPYYRLVMLLVCLPLAYLTRSGA